MPRRAHEGANIIETAIGTQQIIGTLFKARAKRALVALGVASMLAAALALPSTADAGQVAAHDQVNLVAPGDEDDGSEDRIESRYRLY